MMRQWKRGVFGWVLGPVLLALSTYGCSTLDHTHANLAVDKTGVEKATGAANAAAAKADAAAAKADAAAAKADAAASNAARQAQAAAGKANSGASKANAAASAQKARHEGRRPQRPELNGLRAGQRQFLERPCASRSSRLGRDNLQRVVSPLTNHPSVLP